jgi:large subunit ribosomal protein L23
MAQEPHQVVIRPVVTEKAYNMQAGNTYTFEVAATANKAQIKDAVEALFDVRVVDVRTIPKRGKLRRRRWKQGRTRRWKKAMVKLAPEHTLDIM